jgi:hypothetical protein
VSLVLAVVLLIVGLTLIVLGLVGLIRPARYHAMMRSTRPIAGLRLISSVELAVGVVIVVIALVLLVSLA